MNKKGFTLIELLIVVTIIGILAVALVPRIIGGSGAARDSRRMTDVQSIVTGLEYYLVENGNFSAIGAVGPGVCASTLEASLSAYIKNVPLDPVSNNANVAFGSVCTNEYAVIFLADDNGGLTRYAVGAKMENADFDDESVYDTPATKNTYVLFTGALTDYTLPAHTPYYVVY